MKLYRTKIPVVAKETIDTLCEEGDIEVEAGNREEAEQDLVAIMEEFMRHFSSIRSKTTCQIAAFRTISTEKSGRKCPSRWDTSRR